MTEGKPARGTGESQVVHRLVRTLSGRSDHALSAASSSTTTTVTVTASAEQITIGSELRRVSSASSWKSASQKLSTVGEFFKRLTKDFPKLRTRGSGKTDQDVDSGPMPTVTLSSEVVYAQVYQPRNDAVQNAGGGGGHAKWLSMVAEGEEPTDAEDLPSDPTPPKDPPPEDPAEPGYLARKIQELIDSLPMPKPGPSQRPTPITRAPKPPARDKQGRPIPPPNASPIKDSRLIALLQSATIMNGGKDGTRPSVWSILESFSGPPHEAPPTGDQDRRAPERGGGGEANHDDGNDGGDVFMDNASIMMYSPIIPTKADIVEVAELVPVAYEEEVSSEAEMAIDAVQSIPQSAWMTMWPLASWFSASQGQTPVFSPQVQSTSETNPPFPRAPFSPQTRPREISDEGSGRVRIRSKAWAPSEDKMSVQVFWWGYRLYLPPPVMAILSDKTIEATKRAAMITTALTWFFNNIPLDVLPITIRPTVMLLQRLAPYLGYIGTFIAWSWSTIKSYDIGRGIILTATWLLPIALIPGTWYEWSFPKSPAASEPVPLPPADPVPAPPTQSPTPPPTAPTSPQVPTSPPPEKTPTQPPQPELPTSPAPTPIPSPTQPAPPTIPPQFPPTPPDTQTPATPISPPHPTPESPIPTPDGSPIAVLPPQTALLSPYHRWLLSTPSSTSSSGQALSPKTLPSVYASAVSSPTGWGRAGVAVIPVAPTPEDLPPVPPVPHILPAAQPVPPGSPLGVQLLESRRVETVPLPPEEGKRKKRNGAGLDKAKALFVRSSSSNKAS